MVIASWWVARSTAWSRPPSAPTVTAYVVTSRAARRVRVRTTRATAAWAAARMPGRSGASEAPSRRAARTTTASRAAALATCASTEPQADPAMPIAGDRPGAVHEEQVEGDVEQVADDGDHQRGAGVLQAAEHAGRGEHDQERGGAEERDPQVRRRRVGDGRVGAERADQGLGEHDPQDGHDRADQDRQPDAVDPLGQCTAPVAGAESAGDARGGAVGEEDAQPDGGLEDHRGDPETGQRRGAEVADDGSVGEQEHRLRDQRQERGDGEPNDLAVVRVRHPERLRHVMDRQRQ